MATIADAATLDQGLLDRVLADLDRDGYAVVESLLSSDEATAVRDGLREVLDRTPTGRNDFEGYQTRRIYALFAKTRAFDGLALHPLLLGVLDAVRTMPERLQELFGYGIHPPFVGYVDGRHPRRVLDSP